MKRCPEGGVCSFVWDDEEASCARCGCSREPPSETELAFRMLEHAIDRHPRLNRLQSVGGEPEIRLSRLGVMLRIAVKLSGENDRVGDISARGRTVNDALVSLLQNLDTWAVALCTQLGRQ
jgi:hypothetical protein